MRKKKKAIDQKVVRVKLTHKEEYSTKERVDKMLQKKTKNVPEEKRKELMKKFREKFGPFYGEEKEDE